MNKRFYLIILSVCMLSAKGIYANNDYEVKVIFSSKNNSNIVRPLKRYIMYQKPAYSPGRGSTMVNAWSYVNFEIFNSKMNDGYVLLQPYEIFFNNDKLMLQFYSGYSQDFDCDYLFELDKEGKVINSKRIASILKLDYKNISKRIINDRFFPDENVLQKLCGEGSFRNSVIFLGKDLESAAYYLAGCSDPIGNNNFFKTIIKVTLIDSKLRYQIASVPSDSNVNLYLHYDDINTFNDPYNKILVDKDGTFYEVKNTGMDVIIYKFKILNWNDF